MTVMSDMLIGQRVLGEGMVAVISSESEIVKKRVERRVQTMRVI
jgi:hypothetical protein